MATDNIYPLGINATTGLPERASTAYSGIAGDFVSVLNGVSGGNAQTISNSTNGAISLELNNANLGTSAQSSFQVLGGVNAVTMYGFSSLHATHPGEAAVQLGGATSNRAYFNSTAGMSFHAGGVSDLSTTQVAMWRADGADPITITPTTLAANTDNWSPTDYAGAEIIRVAASSAINLTGLVAPTTGSRKVTLNNIGAEIITIINNATSTAANRFDVSLNKTLDPGATITFFYDDTTSRWKILSVDWVASYQNSIPLNNLAYVQLNGGGGTQTIQLDANAATVLEISNQDAGGSAAARQTLATAAGSLVMESLNSGGSDNIESTQDLSIRSAAVTNFIVNADPKYGVNATGRFDTFDSQAITAVGNTISPGTSYHVLTANGNYTMTSTPTITAGTSQGQRLTIEFSGANSVVLQRESALAGSTLRLGAATRTLAEYDTIELLWNGTYWLETSFTDNT